MRKSERNSNYPVPQLPPNKYYTDLFSKYEVPHGAIEDILLNALETTAPVVAVTAVPDASRGEKIVVVYTKDAGDVDSMQKIIEKANIPNLWKPSRDAYIMVEAIPMLGTGKTDLKALRSAAYAAMQ
jgi:acyl-[acyl-carrier-protein]-phospholipid O-acyltransferase / long-chain-fatty-acid--[acyl-carrier-protein] ligase